MENTEYKNPGQMKSVSEEEYLKLKAKAERLEKQKESGQKKIIAVLLVIILLLGIAVFAAYKMGVFQKQEEYIEDSDARKGLLEGRSPDEIQRLLNEIVEEGMLNVSINGVIPVHSDGRGEVKIENIEQNNYIIQVDINVSDENENTTTVYSSGMIKPGYCVEAGTFSVMPPVGAIDAVAQFTAYDMKTEEVAGVTYVNVILEREA